MVRDFLMPSLGADMVSAILVEWLVKPGDRLGAGDLMAVVETDKGAIDIEVFEPCEVAELVASPGTEVPVNGLLARIRTAGEAPAAEPGPAPSPSPIAVERPAPVAPFPAPLPIARTTPGASPAARAEARRRGIDLHAVIGSGPAGAVLLADLAQAPMTAQPARASAPRGSFDPAAMRRAIAASVSRAKREIPHYYLTLTAGLGQTLEWLAEENASLPPSERVLPAVLFLRATVLALRAVPGFAGHYIDGEFRPAGGLHVCWAISLRGGGLIAPALHDADTLPLPALMRALRDLVQRARNGGLRSAELRDGTVTLTSLGERSAETVLPVIQPPQVAMIGFGSIVRRPWITPEGELAAQPVVTLSLAADHRVSDGHRGGKLLAEIVHRLETPELL